MKRNSFWTRRLAIRHMVTAAAGIFGAGSVLLSSSRLRAQDLPQVSEDDATAKQLEYTHDASSSSARQNDDEFCENCMYFKGKPGDAWAACDLFPGKAVAGKGWCNVWSAKG